MRRTVGRIVDGKYVRGTPELVRTESHAVHVGSDGYLVSNSIPLNHPDAPRVDELGRACFASQREQNEFQAKTGFRTMEGGAAISAVEAARAEKRDRKRLEVARDRAAEFIVRRR